jgi:chemotaxis signal transduction protein
MTKKRFLIHSWEGEMYGIDLEEVIEVLEITDMVKTNLEELKITQWNGRNLPVIDPISIFSIGESKLTKDSKIIITEKKNTKFGFLVDVIFGIEETTKEETERASVNEKRFVLRTAKNFKITDMGNFLDENMMKIVTSAYQVRIADIYHGEKLYHGEMRDREFVMNALKMETLNFLIDANRRKLDEIYLKGIVKIQKIIEKI